MKAYFIFVPERKHLIILFLLILGLTASYNDLFSQGNQSAPSRQTAIDAFSKKDYKKAYDEFGRLLATYPKDPLYKYYSGVCLVMLKKDTEKAVTLLEQSLNSAAVVKSLPPDALLYLGNAQQMSGKFAEANRSYNLYTEKVGKKVARGKGVPALIQQCNEEKGMVHQPESKTDEPEANMKPENLMTTAKPEVTGSKNNGVKKETPEQIALPANYENIADEALVSQSKADSIDLIIDKQKNELKNVSDTEKEAMKKNISDNELLADSLQKSADQKFKEAEMLVSPVKVNQEPDITTSQKDNKIVNEQREFSDSKVINEAVIQPDTLNNIISGIKIPLETYAIFKVLPVPIKETGEKIPIGPEVPEGLVYRIQIAVFRNPVAMSYFKGITPIYGFKVAGTDNTTYYAGMFRRSADAKIALAEVKAKGFKDAFIVGLSGTKSVSADRAAVMEKEWGNKPFAGIASTLPDTPLDTLPPTLSFRVEVIRSVKPLKDDAVEGIRKLAGSRGLDTKSVEDGKIVYLIGNFITFESASDYADLLVRNNYREAKVVAWMGNREIPVETAKQLFNYLE